MIPKEIKYKMHYDDSWNLQRMIKAVRILTFITRCYLPLPLGAIYMYEIV